MSIIGIVFRKEMIDNLRDRRSILVAMIYPLMGPLLLGLLFTFVGSMLKIQHGVGGGGAAMVVDVAHAENAPEFAAFLKAHGVIIRAAPDDPVGAVRRDEVPYVLILPDRPVGAAGGPLEVKVVTDPARLDSIVASGQVLEILSAYERETTAARLSAAGVDPKMMSSLTVVHENVGRAGNLGFMFLNMIPPFLMFTLFIGGVYLTLDATSGERERGSFEPLMINPVTRSQVLIGKLGAAVVFTLVALAVQVVAFWVMLHSVPSEALGIGELPSVLHLALLLPVCFPLALFAVATQLIITAVTRSMKEAQTYLGLLPLVPGIAGMILVFVPVKVHSLLAAIPTFGQTLLMGQIVRSEEVSWALIGVAVLATLVFTAALLALGFRLYEREEILFPA
ncbi:MAG TPA: ABC transporter permease subunit [Alphaproteobacteria bacterium]|nr:ABC transporter permease subunit [Alphaproteobacteria bacterium]